MRNIKKYLVSYLKINSEDFLIYKMKKEKITMTQEEKSLLLKDICARVPYGVICTDNRHGASKVTEVDIVSEVIYLFDVDEYAEIKNCKPYLRPMSSMTEEEIDVFKDFQGINIGDPVGLIDWLNAHHFDFRGLIPKGLALEAPKGMYK